MTPLLPEGNAGPTPDANKLTTAREAFDFFLERKVVWKIVEYTNNSIAYYLQTVKEGIYNSERIYEGEGHCAVDYYNLLRVFCAASFSSLSRMYD